MGFFTITKYLGVLRSKAGDTVLCSCHE